MSKILTLKEELEILRGEPIQIFTGDPLDIPCIETSDPEKLCKHPVVSVHMITYNHEPYIRQAIEGVMMQKTDFEFELVIGEDCSTDKTREICFEYQKRYPDKIRVLWSEKNLCQNPHPAGGNGRRVTAHCRGEFTALCEGDDYWTDAQKLQKQVDVFRKCANVSLVSCGGIVVDKNCKRIGTLVSDTFGEVSSESFVGRVLSAFWFGIATPGTMYRRNVIEKNFSRMPYSRMCFRCGDTQLILTALSVGDIFFLPDTMFAYRRHGASATGSPKKNYYVGADGLLVRYAYSKQFMDKRSQRGCFDRYCEYVVENGHNYISLRMFIRCWLMADYKIKLRTFKRLIWRCLNRYKNFR